MSVIAALGLLIAACSTDDSADAAGRTASTELEAALATIVDETGVPALGAALFDRAGPIDMGISGVRQRGDDTAVTVDDLFHIGSNTKAMTAALLARLIEQDVPLEQGDGISFDTTLAEAFPDLDIHPDYQEVTLTQLLTHTAGAPGDDDPLDVDEAILSMPVVEGRALGAEAVLAQGPVIEPGTAVAYSNVGYVVVGAALERATGRSWEDLMIAEVFTPLSMDSCAFGPPGTEGELDQPAGHDHDGRPVHDDLPALLGPAGTVHCSMADWGRFLVELLNAERGESDYLSSASVDDLLRPAPIPFDDGSGAGSAPGWIVLEGPDGPGYLHDGSNGSWYSQAMIVPGADRALLAVANEEDSGTEAVGLAFAALFDLDTGS